MKSIKQYNAKKKFIKIVNSEIVFVDFPDSTLVNILAVCKQNGFAVNKNDKLKTKKEGYVKWKDEIKVEDSINLKNNDISFIERIASFSLATKIPIRGVDMLLTKRT